MLDYRRVHHYKSLYNPMKPSLNHHKTTIFLWFFPWCHPRQDPWQPLPGGALRLGAAAPARMAQWQIGCGRGAVNLWWFYGDLWDSPFNLYIILPYTYRWYNDNYRLYVCTKYIINYIHVYISLTIQSRNNDVLCQDLCEKVLSVKWAIWGHFAQTRW